MPEQASPATLRCPGCGTELSTALLSCPQCQRLVHADELKALAGQAEASQRAGDLSGALAQWRSVQSLLPPETRQHALIAERIAGLSTELERGGAARPAERGWSKGVAGLGALGLLAWKFKFLLVLALTKGKLLLLGLTKASTVLSMALSMGVYWSLWGWRFALGFVAAMYVHEMGHVAALRRYGIAATAPMFVPGLGAFVRYKQHRASAVEDARVGLSGPLWGLAAAVAAWAASLATSWPSLAAIAHASAWLNLFNLLPLGSLDGGRGFRALSRPQRWIAAAALAGMWFWTGEALLLLLLIVAVGRAMAGEAPQAGHRSALLTYVGLVVALALLSLVRAAELPAN